MKHPLVGGTGLGLLCCAALLLGQAAPAAAAPGGGHGGGKAAAPTGYDISYPQCGGSFPGNVAFGIVGTDDGLVLSANPCLGSGDGPSELAWAQQAGTPSFYANTGDPGPAYSSHWDISQWNNTPQACSSTDPNSTGCSFDYGWYAAAASFANAVTAEEEVNGLAAAAAATKAAGSPWWLDVETANSWESLESAYSADLTSAYANDVAALQGEVGYLSSQGIGRVGFYSTGGQWSDITGGAGFGSDPDWLAGYRSLRAAKSACTRSGGFSGGQVALTQYPSGGFDADYQC